MTAFVLAYPLQPTFDWLDIFRSFFACSSDSDEEEEQVETDEEPEEEEEEDYQYNPADWEDADDDVSIPDLETGEEPGQPYFDDSDFT